MSQNKDTSNISVGAPPPQSDQPGLFLASASHKIFVYEGLSKQQVCTISDSTILNDPTKKGSSDTTSAVSCSWSDDNKILAFCESGSNKIFFSKSGADDGSGEFIKSYTICEASAVVTDVQFSQDSLNVAYGCSNGTVGILNLKSKKKDLLITTHKQGSPIVAVHYNMNDTLVASASIEGTIYIQGTSESNKTAVSFSEPYHITCMKFSAVKSSILAAGFDNGKIIIWDVQSATKKCEMQAHSSQCSQIAFSPVNNLLLTSCGHDGKIQFFDIATTKNVKTIYTKNDNTMVALTSIAFCHDGHTIAVGAINGKIYINNLKDKTKGQIEISNQEGKKINCLHFSRPLKPGVVSGNASALILASSSTVPQGSSQQLPSKDLVNNRPSSASIVQSAVKPLTTATIAQSKITLGEVQNSSNQSALKPPSLAIKPQQKGSAVQQLSSGNTGSQSSLSINQSQSSSISNLSQRILHQSKSKGELQTLPNNSTLEDKERVIKIIEEQKIDNTKKRLELQIQQMHQEISQMAGINGRKSVGREEKKEPRNNNETGGGRSSFLNEETIQISRAGMNLNREQEDKLRKNEEEKAERNRQALLTQDLVDYLGQEIEARSELLTHQLSQAMNNLHLELIRNFTLQENELRETLDKVVGQNKQRRQELKYLREENLKLRNISY